MSTPRPTALATRRLLDHAKRSGLFNVARISEPKSKPGQGLTFALWAQNIGAAPQGSGLAATAGQLHLSARIYASMVSKDDEAFELAMIDACDAYMARITADYTLGGSCRNIDLLSEMGEPCRWTFGYLNVDGSMYRIADLELYVIFNDLWPQSESA